MRSKADVTVQKMLGMGADTWGAITLAFPLAIFEHNCLYGVSKAVNNVPGITYKFWQGPGWSC